MWFQCLTRNIRSYGHKKISPVRLPEQHNGNSGDCITLLRQTLSSMELKSHNWKVSLWYAFPLIIRGLSPEILLKDGIKWEFEQQSFPMSKLNHLNYLRLFKRFSRLGKKYCRKYWLKDFSYIFTYYLYHTDFPLMPFIMANL